MSRFGPVGLKRVTKGPWTQGDVNQGRNKIFGVDPVDGSTKMVCEVFGYTHDEVQANIDFILNSARDSFWKKTP